MSDLALDDLPHAVTVRPEDVDTHGQPIHLSNDRWRRLLEFVLLNQEDLDLLASATQVAARADEVAQSFYDHILNQPELREIINANSTLDRLRATLTRYVEQ